MKKIFSMLLLFLFVFTMGGCNSADKGTDSKDISVPIGEVASVETASIDTDLIPDESKVSDELNSSSNNTSTNSKFMYLFGRVLPTISLMLSMIMKWLPITKNKITSINNSQKSLGLGVNMGTTRQKINRCIRVTSILMSWSLEDSIETADSMKARGYGCTKRTSYSVYKWGTHDIISMLIISVLAIVNGVLILGGYSTFEFYPTFSGHLFSITNLFVYGAYVLLLAYPLILEGKEEITWRLSKYRT